MSWEFRFRKTTVLAAVIGLAWVIPVSGQTGNPPTGFPPTATPPQGNNPTNNWWTPNPTGTYQPNPLVVNMAGAMTEASTYGTPNPYSRPTQEQTSWYVNNHPALWNLSPYDRQAIIQGGPGATMVLSGSYLSNGQPNPFYQNGSLIPNWYVPSTWSGPGIWMGTQIQPNGFAPNASATTYNPGSYPTLYNPSPPTYVAPIYQPSLQPPPLSPNNSTTGGLVPSTSKPTGPWLNESANVLASRPTFGDLNKQRGDTERALALSETAGDKIGQVLNHADLARIFIAQGRPEEALAHLAIAEPMTISGDPVLRANLLRTQGAAYLDAGQFEKGLQSFRTAMPLVRNAHDASGEAEIYISVGWAYQSLGDVPRALECYKSALVVFGRSGNTDGVVRSRLAIASLYRSLGKAEDALSQYKLALPIASDEQLARMLMSVAEVLLSRNRPNDALGRYRSALSLIRYGRNSSGRRFEMGHSADFLGKNNTGLSPVDSSGDQSGRRFEIGRTTLGLSMLSGDATLSSVPSHHEENRTSKLAHSAGDPSLEAAILAGMGRCHMAMQFFSAAREDLDAALEKMQETHNRSGEAAVLASDGELEYWVAVGSWRTDPKPHFVAALNHYSQALSMMRSLGDRTGEIGILTNTGLAYEAWGKPHVALDYYLQALSKMEELQASARLEEFRMDVAAEATSLYQQVVGLELDLHQNEEAFAVTERARARTLLDQLGNSRVDLPKQWSQEFQEQEKQLRAKNVSLERQLGQEFARTGLELNQSRITLLQGQLASVRNEYQKLLSDLTVSNPQLASLFTISPLSLKEAQQQIDADVTVLSYFTMPQMTVAFIVTRDSFHVAKLRVPEPQLAHEVGAFLDFSGEDDSPPSLKSLYKQLIAPLESKLKTPMVAIVPHGVLHDLPFAALTPDGNRYFGDNHTIFSLPSISVLPYIRARAKPNSGRMMVLANAADEGLPELSAAYEEARSIASLFGTEPILGNSASTSLLRAKAGEYDILHLIAHIDSDDQQPQFSTVATGGGAGDEGALELHDVLGLDLKRTSLIVLSGCRSDVGRRSRGDDIIALSRAFIYAGAPSVIASLWSVDDRATQELMTAFYRHLKDGMTKAESLHAAEIEVRQRYRNPYYWAGFVLTGDPGNRTDPLVARSTN